MNALGLNRVQIAVQHHDGVAVVALVGVREFGLKLAVFAIAADNVFQRRFDQRRRLLVHLGQRLVIGKSHAAGGAADLAFQQRQQGRFAAAVFVHETDFLAEIDGSGGIIEQHVAATADLQRRKDNHKRRIVRVC